MAECVGSALIHKGFKMSPNQYIGIFAQNRPEWVIIEQGCFAYSMVVVPLYDTLGAEAITYVVNKAELSLVFVDKPEKANTLLEGVENKLTPGLKIIVIMDSYGTDLLERGKKCGVEILSMKAMEDLGRANRRKPKPPTPEDLAVICFTSGTTGNPKGAMITHRNIVSDCSAFVKMTQNTVNPSPDDTLISFLPLAHMFERVVEKILGLNASDTHISFLPLAHMYEQMMQCVMLCHGAKIGFFQGDIRLLMDDLKVLQPTIFPVVPRLLNRMFDRVSSKCRIVGQTFPLQVCVKGPNVFQGYLKDPAKTAEALDKDGWLHTGDIGKWLPNGTLKIIDRKKHIFKLAQGEYIAPEKIENIYTRSEPVAQVFVYGESLQAFLIGIVVPDVETLCHWARKRGFEGSFEELCRNKDVKKAILEDMVRLGKESGLKPFEQVKGITLHPELFSIDNGLLTPTMKAKRPELRNYFRSQIDELYSTIKV
ncbi:PREDICTED: long-chain-fatty-acid--CoA ligase 1 [Hipposideros armiger]|uniref:long-chain-fatty-acid--CoA ligase n=1 Tax=Hipposideros armiger TaxID=186990 RepID=A0A8B7TG23_HIPAR|nr:PREDICTED: long-chain-fatty-acid--CoA ligase 1 [Hipposideros armiger]